MVIFLLLIYTLVPMEKVWLFKANMPWIIASHLLI